MKVTNEVLKQSMKMKDTIREMLIEQPMTFRELLEKLNIEKNKLNNHIWQLRKYGFIKYSEKDKGIAREKKRYYVNEDMGAYADMMNERRAINYKMSWKDAHKAEILPHARVICFEDKIYEDKLKAQSKSYKEKSRISAWSGYTSIGGI